MHPVDMIKVRVQLGQGSAFDIVRGVLQREGTSTFYNGWTAQMARQLTYGTVRLGLFQWLRDRASSRDASGRLLPPPFLTKVALGLAAGTAGAITGNPAEVALVRMQADKMLPMEQRRNYRNVLQAVYRIGSEEGPLILWRGCGPTVLRAAATNASALATYDQTKDAVDCAMGTSAGAVAVCCAGTVSGIMAAVTSQPFDFVKTQIQQMRPLSDGTMPFSGMCDCALKTISSKGPTGLYVGFPVYCVRICPAVAIIWVALEVVIGLEKRLGL